MCSKRIQHCGQKNAQSFVVYKIFAHKLAYYGDLCMNASIGMDE